MALDSGRSLEKTYRSAVAGFYARLRSNYDFIIERFGDEGIALIAEMGRRYGLQVAARAKGKVEAGDALSVGRYLARIFETADGKEAGEIAEMTAKRVVIKATFCPMRFSNREMCLAHTAMEKTVVETLAPNLTYRIGKSLSGGDTYCEHIIEAKEG